MIKVGDIVECIDDSNIFKGYDLIKKGNLYVISSIREYHNGIGVTLEEVSEELIVINRSGKRLFKTKYPYSINRFSKVDVSIKERIEEIELCKN